MFAFIFITQQVFAQFSDDFSDGDFTTSPAWTGMSSKFVVADQTLKLLAPATNDFAYLALPSSAIYQASWEFGVSLDFNPSNTNYARIYLISDQPRLSEPLNGYFVQLGNTTDDVSLYKQTGTSITKIIDGQDGRLDLSVVRIKIKVIRDSLGLWDLSSAIEPTDTYISEGAVNDVTVTSSLYFGIFCNYTSTRADKFFFDDLRVTGSSPPDIGSPQFDFVEATSSNELQLTFSEEIDKETAEAISNYCVIPDIGNPTKAILQQNGKIVLLFFLKNFSNGLPYTITVAGIKDPAGNVVDLTGKNFRFIQPVPANNKDIIFTEILADPSPRVGLPELEFVEIFNRSENPFDLEGWQVMDESSILVLQGIILLPGEYLILTTSPSAFDTYGNAWGNLHFPSLNNAGDMLRLKDANGLTVDSLNYSVAWYKNQEESLGGWSLELIDPENLCSEKENWTVSIDSNGGTPGGQNSVFANKPDLKGPILLAAVALSPTILQLTFDEKLEKQLPQQGSFSTEPSTEITGISFQDATLTRLQLSIAGDLRPAISYSITATAIYDCTGNSIDLTKNKMTFGLPETANEGDIVINEILFNPRPTGVDFVEIVNTSPKFINLKNWSLTNIEQLLPMSAKPLTQNDFVLQPAGYLVLTEDQNVLKGEYPFLEEANVLAMEDLPVFNDNEGSVAVVDDHQAVIDYFLYTDDIHSPFIDDDEGVSLERIVFDRPSNEIQNWKSASPMAGSATPGYRNSNAIADPTWSGESIKIEPEAFIPVVGQPDFTQIHFRFDQGGYVANVKIYDDLGHVIKQIANNEILGTEGTLRWDGDRDDGAKARVGYYMIWFEVFDATGGVKTFRKRVAITTRF